MLDLSHLIGTSKKDIEAKITFVLQYNNNFSKWFNNKFMKYEGLADYSDIDTLQDSLFEAMKELVE